MSKPVEAERTDRPLTVHPYAVHRFIMNPLLIIVLLATRLLAEEKAHDIVVYGGTSGGIIDAIYEGDHRFQAYCYRMVLTDLPENRVMIEKPEGYDEATYEILFRAIAAGQALDSD